MKEIMRGIVRTSFPLASGGGKIRDPMNEVGIAIGKCDSLQGGKTRVLLCEPENFLSTEKSKCFKGKLG